MIRIEGIPVVAARLASAGKMQVARNRDRKTLKVVAFGKALLAVWTTLHLGRRDANLFSLSGS
jgi:hypothetical protein